MRRTYVAPYARWSDGDFVGFDERWRFLKGLDIALHRDSMLIVTSGVPPGSKKIHAEVLRDYLVSIGVDGKKIILNPQGCNTVSDTLAIIEAIQNDGGVVGDQVVVVSSWYHIPRVWMIWKILGLKKIHNFQVKFRVSW